MEAEVSLHYLTKLVPRSETSLDKLLTVPYSNSSTSSASNGLPETRLLQSDPPHPSKKIGGGDDGVGKARAISALFIYCFVGARR